MKKKRRIEITTVRRRTTIIVRQSQTGIQNGSLQQALSELAARTLDREINQLTQVAEASLVRAQSSDATEIISKPDPIVGDSKRKWIKRIGLRRNKR